MENSDLVSHATEIVSHIGEAVGSLQHALELIESSEAPTPAELYLLARLDIAIDLLRVELPQTEEALGFRVGHATGSD